MDWHDLQTALAELHQRWAAGDIDDGQYDREAWRLWDKYDGAERERQR